jgi:arylsulfatase A-like enzyme
MPEFDRLRAQALTATNAFSPAQDTSVSVPSLLTGTQFHTSLYGVDARSTIFSDVRGRGGNAAVAGWYLPYCRVFAQDLSACSWYDNGNILNITGEGLGENVGNQLRSLFETSLFSPFGQSLTLKHAVRMVTDIRRDAVKIAADPSFDLVFLHFPVPHAPHPYDRGKGTFTRANSGFEGYADSLALADVLLGEVRSAMGEGWDSATVLVTSDHPYRQSRLFDGKDDPRVPFLLKLPGQNNSLVYEHPLHTLVTRTLLNAILRGEVATAGEAAGWFGKDD